MPSPLFQLLNINGETLFRPAEGDTSSVFEVTQHQERGQPRKLAIKGVASEEDHSKAALALIHVCSPVVKVEALTSGVSFRPEHLGVERIMSLAAAKLLELSKSESQVLGPGDLIRFRGHDSVMIKVLDPPNNESQTLQDAEEQSKHQFGRVEVQVDSSLPDPTENKDFNGSRFARNNEFEVQVNRSMQQSGDASNRARTPTQSRGPTIQETPATNQRTTDMLAWSLHCSEADSFQLQDCMNRHDFDNVRGEQGSGDNEEVEDEDERAGSAARPSMNAATSQELTGVDGYVSLNYQNNEVTSVAGDKPTANPIVTNRENANLSQSGQAIELERNGENSGGSNQVFYDVDGGNSHHDSEPKDHDFPQRAGEESQLMSLNDLLKQEARSSDLMNSDEPNNDASSRTPPKLPRAVSPIDEEEDLPLRDVAPVKSGRKRKSANGKEIAPASKRARKSTPHSKKLSLVKIATKTQQADPGVSLMGIDNDCDDNDKTDDDDDDDDDDTVIPSRSQSNRDMAAKKKRSTVTESEPSLTTEDVDDGDTIIVAPLPKPVVLISKDKGKEDTYSPPHQSPSTKRSSTATKEKLIKAMRLAFSNSSVPYSPELARFLTSNGFKTIDKLTTKTYDALIIGAGEVKKTSKLLFSLLLGKTIATDSWIVESHRKGIILDPAAFMPDNLRPNLPRDRLFTGKTLFFTPALKKEYGAGFKEIEELSKLAGASGVVSKPYRKGMELDKEMDTMVVLGLELGDYDASSFVEHGVDCYTKDLLSSSILRGICDLGDEEFRVVLRGSQGQNRRRKTRARG